MNAQAEFKSWLEEVSDLDITTKQGLNDLYRKLHDLNQITQQADKEVEW